jgi:signal transduction histidine kinase/ActR/RegA family two-component response regulator
MTTDGSAPAMDSMQLIASLFALLPIPVAVADDKGGIVLSNSSFAEVFHDHNPISGMSQREVHSPGHGTFELHTLPLNDQGYKIVYATDVSIQRLLGRQLEQLEKMAAIGRIVTGIAKELNNPLADVLDYVPMVEQCSMDSTARSIVDVVFTNAERAGHLVQNVLVLAGTTESQHVPFDLNEIVRNVAVQRGTRNSDKSLDITVDLESNLPRALGYPSQIEQVITSLIANAEDAIAGTISGQGSIQVQTGRRAGRVLVQIADNGQSRDLVRIFTPGSAGVGLNVCAEIAKDHGGDLYAWNANGNGSRFTLELPVFGQESVRTSSSVGLGKMLQDKSVLVVDDKIQITELIYDVLVRHGANVQVSGSSVDACERLGEKQYDLIICDQSMPGLSGENLYRLMKSDDPVRSPLFLFMTGEVITPQARQFYAQSGVQYLRKPFRIQDLVEAVEGLLSRNPPPGF